MVPDLERPVSLTKDKPFLFTLVFDQKTDQNSIYIAMMVSNGPKLFILSIYFTIFIFYYQSHYHFIYLSTMVVSYGPNY